LNKRLPQTQTALANEWRVAVCLSHWAGYTMIENFLVAGSCLSFVFRLPVIAILRLGKGALCSAKPYTVGTGDARHLT
jgi:hypothetical protein